MPTARMDTVEVAIGFLPRRSHKLVATPIAPVCRLGSPFCSAPRSISPLGLVVSRLVPVLSVRPVLVSSSRHLILLSCRFYRYPVGACPNSWRRREQATGGGGVRSFFFSRAPFSPAHYHSPRHQVLIIGGASDRCGLDGTVSTVSSHHLIRIVSLVPIVPSHHGAEALVSVVFQASNNGMAVPRFIISSHHFIPSPSWSVSPAVSSHGVSSGISSPYTGSSTGTGRTKQASEHAKPGRETEEQDGETNGTRTARQRETEERNEDDGKQSRGRGNGDMRQSRTRTKRPSFLFARPPRRRFSSVRRPQLVPRPRSVG